MPWAAGAVAGEGESEEEGRVGKIRERVFENEFQIWSEEVSGENMQFFQSKKVLIFTKLSLLILFKPHL